MPINISDDIFSGTNMNIFAINAVSSTKTTEKTNDVKSCTNGDANLFSFVQVSSSTSLVDVSAKYTSEIVSMVSMVTDMADNVEILSKLNANGLTSIALNASSKGYSIINSVKNAISSYAFQISSIINNPFLSDEEKKSQIAFLEAKIKACANEGTSKISDLYCISEVAVSLVSTFIALEDSGFNTDEMISMFTKILSNVNTKPSDFSSANNKNDLSDIVKDNEKERFGKNSTEMFNKFLDSIEKNIKENEEKLKSKQLTPEEEKRIKLELVLYKSEKSLLTSLSK